MGVRGRQWGQWGFFGWFEAFVGGVCEDVVQVVGEGEVAGLLLDDVDVVLVVAAVF